MIKLLNIASGLFVIFFVTILCMGTAEATTYSWTCDIGNRSHNKDAELSPILEKGQIIFGYNDVKGIAQTSLSSMAKYSSDNDNVYLNGYIDIAKNITYQIWGSYTIDGKRVHVVKKWWLRLCRGKESSIIVKLNPCERTAPSAVRLEEISIDEETPLTGDKSKCPNCCATS
jgi:hypothetical protein